MADIKPSRELKQLKIITAIDVSGSTSGHTLRSEIQAIRGISAFIDTPTEDSLTVLPWNNRTRHPIRLPKGQDALSYLESSGGTRPSCLYEDPSYLDALRSIQLWILLTDGLIDQHEIEHFATRTTELCLHGIPSIVIVFAYTSLVTPANTDTSVGLAIYARSPDSLFLLHDLSSGSLYIISAKGSFECLLKDQGQPDIIENSTWADLPTMEYKDLANIAVSPPKKLTQDEIALQDGVVIKLEDLFAGKYSADVERKIPQNPVSMSSLVLTERSSKRSATPRLFEWINKQQSPLPPMPKAVLEKDNEARMILERLLKRMDRGETDAQLNDDRTALRNSHEANWTTYTRTLKQHEEAVQTINRSNEMYRNVSNHVENMKTNLSSRAIDTLSPTIYGIKKEPEQPLEIRPRKCQKRAGDVPASTNTLPKLGDCFLSGFKVVDVGSGFVNKCSVCHRVSVLALILMAQRRESKDKVVMRSWSDPSVILYPKVCCDACASYIIESSELITKEVPPFAKKVAGALVLNSARENLGLYLKTLNATYVGAQLDLPLKEWVRYLDQLPTLWSWVENQDTVVQDAVAWIKSQFEEIINEDEEQKEKAKEKEEEAQAGDGDSEFTFIDRP